jgi:putative sigma-54 modulation protein
MKLKISFKHLEHTPALDQRIKEKSERFEKYFQGNVSLTWFCWVQDNVHWAEIKLHGPKFDFFAKGSSDNLYKCLDIVCEKMERQIERQKDQMKNKLHSHPYQTPKYKQIEECLRDEEKMYIQDIEEKSA